MLDREEGIDWHEPHDDTSTEPTIRTLLPDAHKGEDILTTSTDDPIPKPPSLPDPDDDPDEGTHRTPGHLPANPEERAALLRLNRGLPTPSVGPGAPGEGPPIPVIVKTATRTNMSADPTPPVKVPLSKLMARAIAHPVSSRTAAAPPTPTEAKVEDPQPIPAHTPSDLSIPTMLMHFPLGARVLYRNNAWVEDDPDATINFDNSYREYLEVYSYIASQALVYLLPVPKEGLEKHQDMVFTANVGAYLPHKRTADGEPIVIMANYTSTSRQGEEKYAARYLRQLGYTVYQPETKFEGRADLLHLRDNIYLGQHGIRTDQATYKWLEEHFDAQVISAPNRDKYCYHADCVFFPITADHVMTAPKLLDRKTIKQIEKVANIVPISRELAQYGVLNNISLNNLVLNASVVTDLEEGTREYAVARKGINRLESICSRLGLEPVIFSLNEMTKLGAMLSCLHMPLYANNAQKWRNE